MRPAAVSIRSILPGSSLPFATISADGTSRTPLSLARMIRSSIVRHHRPGRNPLRSNTAPTTVPSVNVTQAGPSHGSIRDAWNCQNERRSGVMAALFSHASGIIMSTAWGRLRPPRCSSSSTWSNDAESDASGVQIGDNRSRSPGILALASFASRACMRLRFPRTVLISPLCATKRNGCASGQDGNVLVENLLCTIAMALAHRSSRRSGKNCGNCIVVSMPL